MGLRNISLSHSSAVCEYIAVSLCISVEMVLAFPSVILSHSFTESSSHGIGSRHLRDSSLASSKSKTSRFSTCSTGLRLLELITEVYAHFTFSVSIGGTLVCSASLIYLWDNACSLSLLGGSFGGGLSRAAFKSSSQSLL